MRPELELIETIEKYLTGKLNDVEKSEFEKRLSGDSKLRQEVKLQQDIMNGIKRSILKQKIQRAYNKYNIKNNFLKWGGFGTVVIIVIGTILFSFHHYTAKSFIQNLPELNELSTKQWSDADKYLPNQLFAIDPTHDTVIQTKEGMVIAVPANCFLDDDGKPASGQIELEVKEALDPVTIMKAGLSTKSGDKLLESAGMFYLNGRKDGKSLKIDPANAIYVHVPADTIKTGMQAFEGKRMPDGTVDWVNPKPLTHTLVPVNIHALDFYPPNYLDSLAAWGLDSRNKKFTDSLYYSFASLFGFQDTEDSIIYNGAKLFKANCAVCHSIGKGIITGPGLESINDRVPRPTETWLLNYIKNNVAVRKSGDAYANKIFADNNGTAMTVFEGVLTDNQIRDIIDFISLPQSLCDSAPHKDTFYSPADECGINPAKIKAIWSNEFQNTLISTKEFEERMPYIHRTMNVAILNLYVNNLDKNLSYIDSLATEESSGDLKSVFLSFAARGDGKVAFKSHLLEKLKAFYENKSRLYTEAAAKAQHQFLEKQNKLDIVAQDKENTDYKRQRQMIGAEYKANLKEACRQVGDPDSVGIVDKNGYAVLCTGTGWVNIDAYVNKSTESRTTLNYTSPTNGKKATINYLPFSVTISDYQKYDNVFVYLLPDKLNSFMRINETNGKFNEKLDEIFSYKMECIAYKGNQAFYYSMDNVQPKDYSFISLQPVSVNDLDKKLSELGNKNQRDDMAKEVDYMQYQTQDKKRRMKNEERTNLTWKLKRWLFRCYYEDGPQQQGRE